MNLDTVKSNGKVLVQKGISEAKTEQSESGASEEIGIDSECNGNISNKSVMENGDVTSSSGRMTNGRNDAETPTGSAFGNVDQALIRAIDFVIDRIKVEDDTKERLKRAVIDVHYKLMTNEEACDCYHLVDRFFQGYYEMIGKVMTRINAIKTEQENQANISVEGSVGESNAGSHGKEDHINVSLDGENNQNGKMEESGHRSNDESNEMKANDGNAVRNVRGARYNLMVDTSKIDKKHVDKVIKESCNTSNKHLDKRESIHKAVALVLYDGRSGVDAARTSNIAARTVMKYVYLVRNALNLPTPERTKQKSLRKSAPAKIEGRGIKEENPANDIDQVNDADRNAARMLCDENFGSAEANDFSGSVSELISKIDKVLREFSYDGDLKKVRDAILKIFIEQQKPSEISKTANVPTTVLNSYVRLLNGYFWAEKEVKKEICASSSATPTSHAKGKQRANARKRVGEKHSVYDVELTDSEAAGPSKTKRKSVNVVNATRGVFMGKVDVLALHLENGIQNEEQLMKNIISYLISQQYRRSDAAQTNMQICLEHILLDGLSVAETLKIREGPSGGILEIYQKRCRDAFTSLTVDFPVFIAALNSSYEDVNKEPQKKRSRTAKKNVEKAAKNGEASNGGDAVEFDTVEKLFVAIVEGAKKALFSYIMKLLDANFPVDKQLVGGLLQKIGEKAGTKYILSDKVLEDCVAYFHEKHSKGGT